MPVIWKKKQRKSGQEQRTAPDPIFNQRILITLIIFCCAWGFCGDVSPAGAQDMARIAISSPETGGFPTLSFELKLTGANVESIDTLSEADLTVIENGQSLPVASLTRTYRGILFNLAVNANRELDLRDAEGFSRYDKLIKSLDSWVTSRDLTNGDRWSFATNEGIEVQAADTADEWTTSIDAYQPDFRDLEPELSALEAALQALEERGVSFGVDKVLLYITPPPAADQIDGLLSLAEDARFADIRVNVWMVGDEFYLLNDQGGALMNLAAVTGGQFFRYTGVESIPDPEDYLSSLGYVHTVTYESGIRETGTYSLRIELSLPDMQVSSESRTFYIDVQPPKPILISPPAQINVQRSSEKSGAFTLTPEVYEWQIMVEFPDGYDREIVVSRLYVDGSVVTENREAPFDSFTWDLSELAESGEHTIQVEIEDSLGLSSCTILTPVQVEIIQPGTGNTLSLQQMGLILAGFILTAAFVIFMVWLVGRLLGQNKFSGLWERLFGKKKRTIIDDQSSAPMDESPILAILSPLNDTGGKTIRVTKTSVTIGRDASQVDCVIDNDEVSSVHARLSLHGEGFWLQDLGSDAGTWINYSEIGKQRVRVHPGDLIHFGSGGFRFTIDSSQFPVNVTVSKYEPLL
jgi:hypothetical protein